MKYNSKNNDNEDVNEELEIYKNKYFKLKEELKNLNKNKRNVEEDDDIEDLKQENKELARKLQIFTNKQKGGKNFISGFEYLEISVNVNNFFVLGTARVEKAQENSTGKIIKF